MRHSYGLGQDCIMSFANALEILQACIKPPLWRNSWIVHTSITTENMAITVAWHQRFDVSNHRELQGLFRKLRRIEKRIKEWFNSRFWLYYVEYVAIWFWHFIWFGVAIRTLHDLPHKLLASKITADKLSKIFRWFVNARSYTESSICICIR